MISAILLGAGESKRMGVNKLSLPWGGKTVLEQCLYTLLRAKVKEVIVILNARSKSVIYHGRNQRLKVVINTDYKKGMGTSIRKGTQVINPRSQGILIALGDQPWIKTKTINALIHAFAQGKGAIVYPSFRGQKGHPVIFDRRFGNELVKIKRDEGGRSIIRRYPEDVWQVPVKSEGVVMDIDTWYDYHKGLRSKKGRRRRKGFK
jgi:molybdenum cofactor cytidylyltransferase